jgi:hypothetical protein
MTNDHQQRLQTAIEPCRITLIQFAAHLLCDGSVATPGEISRGMSFRRCCCGTAVTLYLGPVATIRQRAMSGRARLIAVDIAA